MTDPEYTPHVVFDPEAFNSRHPSTQHMLRVLLPNVRLQGEQAEISLQCWTLGLNMVITQEDGPELTTGLRKLLEAKDCFVRNSLKLSEVDYRNR